MDVSRATDTELLTEWVGRRSEPAFQALVARYAGLVHMAARRTCGSEDLAAEVSQLVFILLARKAKPLVSHTSLAGWLHVTAVMQAKNLLRKSQQESRKRHQLLTTMDTEANEQAREAWMEMQPVLDGALAALSEKDREALLLRFYRSLSIREIATTLGIATAAAQKRVDRATERLRDKLARRGCQAGGPLALALVTGFASDAQAAAILVPALTTKAIAVAGASTALSSALIPLALMKTSTYIPPAVVLLLSAAWLVTQHRSAASLETRNDQLASRIEQHSARLAVNVSTAPPSQADAMRKQAGAADAGKHTAGIDWRSIAERITTAKASRTDTFGLRESVKEQIAGMSREELLAALHEVSALDAPPQTIDELENIVGHPLTRRFPEYALTELTDRLNGGNGGSLCLYLGDAFKAWLRKDQMAAMAWLDDQVAAEKFQNRTLNGNSFLRSSFEGALITSLLATDPAAARLRLEAIPPENRGINFGEVRPEDHAAFADLVRTHLDEKRSLAVLEAQAYHLQEGYDQISAYLDRIEARPGELEAVVKLGAMNGIISDILNKRPADFPEMREWVESRIPGAADRVTGAVLGNEMMLHRLGFPEAARLATQYADAGGGDAVLVAFLESSGVAAYKEGARKLAGRISDAAARERVLKKLQ